MDWIKELKDPEYAVLRLDRFEPYDETYWRKGWKHTDEAKQLMSDAKKGKPTWNKGLKGAQTHSEETKEKCRIAGKKSSGSTGKKQSVVSNKKRSDTLKKYYADRRASGHAR